VENLEELFRNSEERPAERRRGGGGEDDHHHRTGKADKNSRTFSVEAFSDK
jgi:hypothetical protein